MTIIIMTQPYYCWFMSGTHCMILGSPRRKIKRRKTNRGGVCGPKRWSYIVQREGFKDDR